MSKLRERSLEERLFEARQNIRGVRLSYVDVYDLLRDDAVATRITNKASAEAGLGELGADEVSRSKSATWEQFKAELKRGCE